MDAESFDSNNNFDSTTNYRYNVPVTGFYQISFGVLSSVTGGGGFGARVYNNGSAVIDGTISVQGGATFNGGSGGSKLLSLTANDYLELYYYGTGGAGGTGSLTTFMTGFLVSIT